MLADDVLVFDWLVADAFVHDLFGVQYTVHVYLYVPTVLKDIILPIGSLFVASTSLASILETSTILARDGKYVFWEWKQTCRREAIRSSSTTMRKWPSLWLLLVLCCIRVARESVHGFSTSVLRQSKTSFYTKLPSYSPSTWPYYSLHACGAASSSGVPRTLDGSGGLLYRKGVFLPDEFKVIADEVGVWRTKLREETSTSVAKHRLGLALPRETSASVRLLKDPTNSLTLLVQKLTDSTYQLSPLIPVEIRSYEKTGAGMAWHVDDILCDPPQIEVVWTLENTSDCATLWKMSPNGSSSTIHVTGEGSRIQRQETDPNSVLLLRAGQTPHCVTSLRRGRRIVLKCAFATTTAIYNDAILYNHQFGLARTKTRVHGKIRGR